MSGGADENSTTHGTDDGEDFEPRKYVILATIVVVVYIVGCNIMYFFVNRYFKDHGSNRTEAWNEIFEQKCHSKLPNLTDNAILACSYVTFCYGCYVFTL